ncbi:hypothetical protein ACFOW4_09045 [Micromonospora sp. GCM10011542]
MQDGGNPSAITVIAAQPTPRRRPSSDMIGNVRARAADRRDDMRELGSETATADELRQRLFRPAERWGWAYSAPAPVAVHPEAARPPVFQQIYVAPDYLFRQKRSKRAWLGLLGFLFLTFWAVVCAGSALRPLPLAAKWVTSLILIVGVVLSVTRFILVRRRFKVLKRTYDTQHRAASEGYEQARADWEQRISEHNQREYTRYHSTMLWHPLRANPNASRVDVFGGTEDGWASLLATTGTAALAAGSSMFILDFSEQAVADNLVVLAAEQGQPVAVHELPPDLSVLNLLGDLQAAELAELIAEAVHSLQRPALGGDLRGLHADLLTAVALRLTGPVTFTRLHAGVQVLRRVHEVTSASVLTADEIRALNSYVDVAGSTEQARNELQALDGALNLIAQEEQAAGEGVDVRGFESAWPARGLSVVATTSKVRRRKQFLDYIVFYRTLRDLQNRHAGGREILVVAGADRVGLDALETMTRQARRVGVRLIFLLEHLRDDLQKLLGGSDSVTILMRLGNGAEAAAAAEFIGRGHRFVLSQLTEQVGRTFTSGSASSVGESSGTSTSRGYSSGSSFSSGGDGRSSSSSTSGYSRSTTRERSQNWSETVNQSAADSTTTGSTQARVYEYTVEPTTLQSLAPTAFVLVEMGMAGRRVIAGDCNPGIVLLDRVAIESTPN